MSLLVPAWGFGNYVHNVDVAAPWPSGTALTSGGSSNTDGTAVQLLSALAFDAHLITLAITGFTVNGAGRATLVDILIDPAGGTSWSELISDLAVGQKAQAGHPFFFPLWVPAGASIGARVRSSDASASGTVAIHAFGDPSRPGMWWCGRAVETLGVTPASSAATAVTPGNGAYGSWTTIGTSTQDYGFLQVGSNGPEGGAVARTSVWEVGAGSVALPVGVLTENQLVSESATISAWLGFCQVKSGTVLQMRGAAVTSQANSKFALYGVY